MFLKPWAHILREPFEFVVKNYQRLHGCNYAHDSTDITSGQTNQTRFKAMLQILRMLVVVVLNTVDDMNHSCVAIEYKLMKICDSKDSWSFEIYCVYTEMWELNNPF